MRRMVVCVGNAKGGTGKTAAAVHVAAALAEKGRTLLIDFDPQASATFWLRGEGDDGEALSKGLKSGDIAPAIVEAAPGLDLAQSGAYLGTEGASYLATLPAPMALRKAIGKLDYRFIVIDCPPSMGHLAYNALAASERLLIPCETSILALAGLAQYEQAVEAVQEIAPSLKVAGVLPSKATRTNHAAQALEALTERYGKLCLSPVPEAVVVRNAASSQTTIYAMAPNHPAAHAYRAATEAVSR